MMYGRINRRLPLATSLCAAALAVGLAAAAPAGAASSRSVTVMSYNIFQGSELSHVLAATSFSQVPAAVAADYANVIKSKIPTRAKALAAEIKTARPALVGLQEAALWRTQFPSGSAPKATHVTFDLVKSLLKSLAADGAHYPAVAITTTFAVQAPGALRQ